MASNRKVVGFLIAALISGMLIFFSGTGLVKSISVAALWVTRPLVRVAMKVGLASRVGTFPDSGAAGATAEGQSFRVEHAELEKMRSENEALRKVFAFHQNSGLGLKLARVLLYSRESGQEFLLLEVGKKDGVREGDLVIDENRTFIGTVRQAGDTFAKVVVVSSPGENIEVEIFPSRTRALAKGLGARALSLELVPAEAVLRKGDALFLAPSRGKYPFPVGEVAWERSQSGATFHEARAVHFARPELLGEVFVVSSSL